MSDLNFTKHWTSERARKKQTALTKLSNGLLKEVIEDPYSRELFDLAEIEAMKVAAKALSDAKKKFAHIKEKKARIEKKKEKQLNNINTQCNSNAKDILDSFTADHAIFTREQFCLWVMVANSTSSILEPELWELDINDGVENHHLESERELKRRNAWIMKDKAHKALHECLKKTWVFSFKDDSWVTKTPISEAVRVIKGLVNGEDYKKVEQRYLHLIESLEVYNREIEAIQRRKTIKSI
ncbi:hypothetical protein FQP87_22365 [Vibrio tasmaniensis]|nr:hypothetical protein FQP87_22365 [Vibrio tasmaniensis]